MQLNDAFKTFTADQDKVLAPEETVLRLRKRLAQIDLDILAETIRIDNGRLDIPVFFSTCGRDARQVIGTKKQMGKGASPAQAEASAVMELAERFSFFSFARNPENFTIATPREIGAEGISFSLIAQSVHDEGPDSDRAREFYEDLPMRWARGFSLTRRKKVMVPFDWFFAINEFNGPSAGNCVEEALSQGICEIVERHVSSVISRERIAVPRIDLSSATDPAVAEMLEKYRRAGIRLTASDFTLQMGIPSVGVLAYDPATFPTQSEIVWTAGTTPDPEKALSRALTEVAQLAGDFNSGSNYVASGLPKFASLKEARYIQAAPETRRIDDLPNLSDGNIKVEVERMVAALADRGLEVIVIDTTHPVLGVPAFYTIVPGAHFRERAHQTSVGMFTAKLATEKLSPREAAARLDRMDERLPKKYYVRFHRGVCRLKAGSFESAADDFSAALTFDPSEEDRATIYSYLGQCFKEMGRYRKALAVLQEGLAIDAERTDILNLMGFCRFKLGDHRQAIEHFNELLRLDPSSAIDYANVAVNYRQMGEKAKAVEYFEMALALDPSIDFARKGLIDLLEEHQE
ncbi:MAG: YcaO-like family protein [Desulfobacterales bacterium]|jgi:ribosomal protein S12 methylthiotransferase accessory factor